MSNENKFESERVAIQAAELFAQISSTLVFAGANEPEVKLHPMYLPFCVLETMGMVERKQGLLSAIVEYPQAGEPMTALRAHYEALNNETTQNYEMLCDGIAPYVEPAHPPSPGKWYADRADSFEMFVGLCVEKAEKNLPTEENLEVKAVAEPISVPRRIFAQCVNEYELITGPCTVTYDPGNLAHQTLIQSGIVGFSYGDQLFGKRYSGSQDGATQLNEHRKACKWAYGPGEYITSFAIGIAERSGTVREFIKKCAEAAAAAMNAERLDNFH